MDLNTKKVVFTFNDVDFLYFLNSMFIVGTRGNNNNSNESSTIYSLLTNKSIELTGSNVAIPYSNYVFASIIENEKAKLIYYNSELKKIYEYTK